MRSGAVRRLLPYGLWYMPILLWTVALWTFPGGDPPGTWRLSFLRYGLWPTVGLILGGLVALGTTALRGPAEGERPNGLRALGLVAGVYVLVLHFVVAVLLAGLLAGAAADVTRWRWAGELTLWGGGALIGVTLGATGASAAARLRDPTTRHRWAAAVAAVLGLAGAAFALAVGLLGLGVLVIPPA